jgi:hypothetical protein
MRKNINKGEQRELKEETGYTATVKHQSPGKS